jgi:hypothetical protein
MKRRLRFFLLLGISLLIGLALLSSFRQEPEPIYQGKKLSVWLDQIQGPSNVPVWNPQSALTPQASEAVRQIGTNAIPALLRKMTLPEGSLRRSIEIRLNSPSLSFLGRFLVPAGFNPGQSIRGFRALGPVAQPVVPELIRRLGDLRSQEWAFFSLCAIGPGSVDEIKNAWGDMADATSRLNVVAKIEFLRTLSPTNTLDFTPVLLKCLTQDPDGRNRAQAANALGLAARHPDQVVPALIEALQARDQTGLVRLLGSEALGKFGTNARPAIPVLQGLLQDKNPAVRGNAATALQRIQPSSSSRAQTKP